MNNGLRSVRDYVIAHERRTLATILTGLQIHREYGPALASSCTALTTVPAINETTSPNLVSPSQEKSQKPRPLSDCLKPESENRYENFGVITHYKNQQYSPPKPFVAYLSLSD